MSTHDYQATIDEQGRQAIDQMPKLAAQVEELIRTVDPVDLLAQLTLLYQTHRADKLPDRDEHSMWQVRIEWLGWLILFRKIVAPPVPRLIDAQILGPLEELLVAFFAAALQTTHISSAAAVTSPAQDELRGDLLMEALMVRGEGHRRELEDLAVAVFEPHGEYCLATLGLTVTDAFIVAHAISTRFGVKLQEAKAESRSVEERVRRDSAVTRELDLPTIVRDAFINGQLNTDTEGFANSISMIWFYARVKQIVGFTAAELDEAIAGTAAAGRAAAFLRLISIGPEDVTVEPNPFHLTPLVHSPMVRFDDRFHLFTPGALFQSVFYAFHFKLLNDAGYRNTYDEVRSAWLETSAVDAFRKMLPDAVFGWDLGYGPKKQRWQLDGLVQRDNKLILIECKWKNPRLIARQGDVDAVLADVQMAILDPLVQAQRARDYIRAQGTATFLEKASGRAIPIRWADVSEVYLVTMVGTGAWSSIAANLPQLAPLGFFEDGEYPWALSIGDLRLIADMLEFPSQLFDYLRRRFDVQRDSRFRIHDESDLLAVYLAGALDVSDPRFEGKDRVGLSGFDDFLQDYIHSVFHPEVPRIAKPCREIPANLRILLKHTESSTHPMRTDAVCAVLAWPDDGLIAVGDMLAELRRKTIWDGRVHASAAKHPWRSIGMTLVCGYRDYEAIQALVKSTTDRMRGSTDAHEWVGFGIDLDSPDSPAILYAGKRVAE